MLHVKLNYKFKQYQSSILMKKLFDKNRQAEIMTKLHLSLQKYENFKPTSSLTQSQLLKQSHSNDELTRQLSKLLESNQRKKNDLKQKLVQGGVGIDLNEEMAEIRERMDILKSHHRSQRSSKSYESLTGKIALDSNSVEKFEKRTFDQLYNIQKQKYAALRDKRKAKRLNLQYLETVSSKNGRKQRNKQLIEEKFSQQMRLLDEAIEGIDKTN